MRNFDYLQDLGLTELHAFCAAAEELQTVSPAQSAVNARKALDYIVRSVYVIKDIALPQKASLFELADGEDFREFIGDDHIMSEVHYVRKLGKNGENGISVSRKEALLCLNNIYNITASVLLKLCIIKDAVPFDAALIPKKNQSSVIVPDLNETITSQSVIVKQANKEAVNDKTPAKEIPVSKSFDISEADTRRLYIDLMLKEAGWDVLSQEGSIQPSKACIEVKVEGMPNNEGIGYCDYVLFGSNGMPLAVIEAKKTSVSPEKGKHQAELYADCFEKRYGRRPVVYFTNGFTTYIIDGLGYPQRRLYAFHTEKDLELLIQKRNRKDISDFVVKENITNRSYQKMAVKSICEHFNKKNRRGLLVMATGTGKTRVSISLVDVLSRNGWVKNVLFLADRTTLVKQAHKNFNKLLHQMSSSILSEDKKPDKNARIIFSTYQTMINYIDTDEKEFSIGRFDLIVIDEAHRSIFGKYSAIFNYFDSLLVGLTATPKNEVDKSTYDIFQVEQGEPNFAYELEEAVADHFLVNYKVLKRGSQILEEGIKYDSLSDAGKEQLDAVWEYEAAKKALEGELVHRDISQNEIFKYIFNEETIDRVLQDLMENGLKVQSGERIGKTIIFAYNHRHAELIVECFNKLYPEYAGRNSNFCVLIDNYVKYAQDLIDKFEKRDNNPQIAVSVDMLDTGIDVPDVLNLVFFKRIKSKIKFLQMIGRGTRLSEDIFGLGKHKECFYIFDWCNNFEYFGKNPEGHKADKIQSLTERIFSIRTKVAFFLQHQEYQEDSFAKGFHDEIKKLMQKQVEALSGSHISVREKWESVSRFKNKNSWICLSEVDTLTLSNDIAPLLPKNTLDENAKKFDLLVLLVELSLLDSEFKADKSIQAIQTIADKLKGKASIPQVQEKMDTIKEVLSETAWGNVSLQWLEKVRKDLRDLLKFIMNQDDKYFTVNIEDIITDKGIEDGITPRVSYKQSVLDYLASHRDLPVLNKINKLEQLIDEDIVELKRILWEELGSEEDYNRCTEAEDIDSKNNVAVFIRSMIGIDRETALKRFSEFISGNKLNADQEEFLNNIIDYVSRNGDITGEIVVNEPPFDQSLTVFNEYMMPLKEYVDVLHNVIIPLRA